MKFGWLLVAALVSGALLISACGPGAAAKPTAASVSPGSVSAEAQKYASLKGEAAKGKTAFDGTCSACHGMDAKGITGLGKDLITSTFAKGLSDADLILFATKGRAASDPANTTKVDMPPRGGNPALTDQDLANIVAYLRTLEK